MPEHLHVIPVDASLTPEEAWDELRLMHVRATDTGSETWATIRCDGQECDGMDAQQSGSSVGGETS